MSEVVSSEKKRGKGSGFGYSRRGVILIIAAIASMFCFGSISMAALNWAVPTIAEVRGLDSVRMYSMVSVVMYFNIAFALLMGVLMRKIKNMSRWISVLGMVACGICIALHGYVTTMWQFFIIRLIISTVGNAGVYYGIAYLIGNWFPKKKGAVMGIATVGFNLGGIIINPFLQVLFKNINLGPTFCVYGALCVIPIILIIAFVPEYPEKCGDYPDNDASETSADTAAILEEQEQMKKDSPFTVKKLLMTKQMWNIMIANGLMMMCTAVGSQLIAAIMERGYTQTAATGLYSVYSVIAIPFSIVLGFIDQKTGTKKAGVLVGFISAAGLFFLAAPGTWALWVGLICCAFLNGTSNNMLASTVVYIFGRYDYQNAYGIIYPLMNCISSGGVGLTAIVTNLTGSFRAIFIFYGCSCLVVGILYVLLRDKMIGRTDPKQKTFEDIAAAAAAQPSA